MNRPAKDDGDGTDWGCVVIVCVLIVMACVGGMWSEYCKYFGHAPSTAPPAVQQPETPPAPAKETQP